MTIEQISDAAKRLKKKYDETDPERLAEQMKILVSREPMGLFEGCCKGFFLVHRRKKHITINGDLPDVLQKVVLAHELGHCVLHSGSSSAAFHEVILFDTADQKEYEANVFASELLLPDEAVLEVLNDDMFFFQAAKALYVPSELLDFKDVYKRQAGRNAEIMAFAGRDSAVTFRLCCRSAAGAGIFPGWPVRRGCAALIYSHPALPGPGRLGKG